MKIQALAGSLVLMAVAFGCGGSTETNDAFDATAISDVADVADTVSTDNAVVPDSREDVPVTNDAVGDADMTEPADVLSDAAQDAVEDVPVVPEPPHANCGMPAYDFLPPGSLGQVVASENVAFLTLDADTINGLLDGLHFTAMSPVPYGVVTYRYRYTTQDRGQQVEATASISYPVGADPITEPLAVISNQHGTTGFSDPCAPSAEANWFEAGALGPVLASLGYVVVSPDYIGMNGFGAPATVRHAYLVGEQTAIGVWDALRAGLSLMDTIPDHPPVSNDVVLWGASQGGHATMFTELWGPWYAPEFDVKAVLALVPPTDLMATLHKAMESVNDRTGLFAISVVTMNIWYGEQAQLNQIFTDEEPYYIASDVPQYLFPEDECEISIGYDVDLDDLTLEQAFTQTAIDAAANEDWESIAPWDCFYMENSLATTSVTPSRFTPTLMIYGQNDSLVDPESQRPDFQRLCDMGYQLDYLECADAQHTEAALWSLPEQFQWIRDRLDGVPLAVSEICQIQDPTTCSATPAE